MLLYVVAERPAPHPEAIHRLRYKKRRHLHAPEQICLNRRINFRAGSQSDRCGARAHAFTEWRLKPPPWTARPNCLNAGNAGLALPGLNTTAQPVKLSRHKETSCRVQAPAQKPISGLPKRHACLATTSHRHNKCPRRCVTMDNKQNRKKERNLFSSDVMCQD